MAQFGADVSQKETDNLYISNFNASISFDQKFKCIGHQSAAKHTAVMLARWES